MTEYEPLSGARASAPERHGGATLLATLALAQMLIGIDYNIVFVALPRIAELGFGAENLQWVVSAYAIGFGGLLLLCGRLVDQVGQLRMFAAGLILFAIGSVVGGAAIDPTMLIAGRAIQGLGGAALAPATLAILATLFHEGAERNRALGVWGAAGSAGMVVGSILGGILTEYAGWRWVFFINLPVALAIGALVIVNARRIPNGRKRIPLDLPGAILTTVAAVFTVAGFTLATESGWDTLRPWLLLGGAAAAIVALVAAERRATDPILDPHLLRRRSLAIGTASTFLFMAGFGAIAYFITLYLQETRGLSAVISGLVFVIPCIGVLLGTRVGALLATRSLRASLAVGNAAGALFTVILGAVIGPGTSWGIVVVLLFALSVGQGIIFTAMFATATTGIPEGEQGSASGIATTGQQLGGALGLAVLVTLVAGSDAPTSTALLAISVIIGAAALVGLAAPSR